MEVERKRKEEPAAKRRNCLRERGERRDAVELGVWAGFGGGVGDDSVTVGRGGRWRNAIQLVLHPVLQVKDVVGDGAEM